MSVREYFETFPLVEVQQTFYEPPAPRTLLRWREQAPDSFEFTMKAWQLITHRVRFLWEPRGPWPQALLEALCAELALTHVIDPFDPHAHVLTQPLTYWRLHGIGTHYHVYTDAELRRAACAAAARARDVRDVQKRSARERRAAILAHAESLTSISYGLRAAEMH